MATTKQSPVAQQFSGGNIRERFAALVTKSPLGPANKVVRLTAYATYLDPPSTLY